MINASLISLNKHRPVSVLPPGFYMRDTYKVAHDLIGKLLIRTIDDVILVGRINETEAYSDDEEACHAFKGKTRSNASLFGDVGKAYVYFIYGNHFCFNAVAYNASFQKAGGVLIRSIIPLHGIEHMQRYRNIQTKRNTANGPGKLCKALQINKTYDGIDLTTRGALYIADDYIIVNQPIHNTPRIGLSKNKDILHRFFMQE